MKSIGKPTTQSKDIVLCAGLLVGNTINKITYIGWGALLILALIFMLGCFIGLVFLVKDLFFSRRKPVKAMNVNHSYTATKLRGLQKREVQDVGHR
jgi:hypothetical protein